MTSVTASLVEHLKAGSKPLVFSEIALDGSWGSMGRLDVVVVAVRIGSGYGSWAITGYEVKASRGDFCRDVDAGKWKKYLGACDRFFFACPAGVAKREEVPDPAGLLTYSNGNWTTVKRSLPLEGYGKGPGLSVALRLLRRAEEMAHRTPPETRLERLERVALYEREEELSGIVSQRVMRMIYEVRQRERAINDRQVAVREQETKLGEKRQAAAEIDELFSAITDIFVCLRRSVPSPWGNEDHGKVRDRIREVAKQLGA